MFLKRSLVLTPALYVMYPYKVHAHQMRASQTVKANYREKFEKMDKEDSVIVTDKRRKEVIKKLGYADLVAGLERDVVDMLYLMLGWYDKPLTPERRISLRRELLPYLEKSKGEMLEFYEHILKYYDLM